MQSEHGRSDVRRREFLGFCGTYFRIREAIKAGAGEM
jgi:hypothetical protein